jgi:hypothetical protein
MASWLIVILIGTALLLATWFAGEWACRRISARYAGRRRELWTGIGPDDKGDGDSPRG